ncbi:MAG TPA: POTRA domain-containing protein [Bryocella sp.]|nr:POTRA domain-containing protein [Bryocella sp.]
MRRAARCLSIAVLLLATSSPLCAQTYNPKSIHFESTDLKQHLDASELLRITGLHEGVPLTRADIEAALQKLGDSGDFSNLTYTVNNSALTIRLTPAAGGQALPVRFTNFVWWQPEDLLGILEQRVPLFHGTLPLQGNQTGEIEDALVALLSEKGIPDARITAMPSYSSVGGPMDAVALSITSPEILVGQTQFDGVIPAIAEKLTAFDRQLADRNFDLRDVNTSIRDNVQQIFADEGYLDGTVDAPTLAAPRKDMGGYVVDVQMTLHPGNLYRVGSIAIHAEPPATVAELRPAIPFKNGDPASASDIRAALTALARVYGDYGYLRAKASANLEKNASNGTVAYSFTFSPGAQFHLASIDASDLSPDLQQEFTALWHGMPGALVDKNFQTNLRQTLEKLHTHYGVFVGAKSDPEAHTVVIVLKLRKIPGLPTEEGDPGTPIPSSAPPLESPLPPIPPPPQSRRPRR